MKNLLFFLFTLLSLTSFSQYHVDSLYENKSELLINEVVLEVDSTSTSDLVKKVKNWAGINFVNMEEVLVSETNDQLVFNYITDFVIGNGLLAQSKNWYIRMVIQFKDGKVRIRQYDDGNAFWPGSYSGGVSVPATSARKYRLTDYFKKDGTSTKMYSNGLKGIKSNCLSTIESIDKSLTNPIQGTSTSDDW